MNQPDSASIIIAVWNQLGYTKLTVEHILKNTDTPFELVIIDNGSNADMKEYFSSVKERVEINYIRNDENLGPIRAINQGIRAAICWGEELAQLSRAHNNANVLALGARMMDDELAKKAVKLWLETPFDGGRHQQRIEKLDV